MAKAPPRAIARHLVAARGRLYSRELGIRLERGTPLPLFCWPVAPYLPSQAPPPSDTAALKPSRL